MKLRKRVFPVRLKNCVINEKNVSATKFSAERDRGLQYLSAFSVIVPSFNPINISKLFSDKRTSINVVAISKVVECSSFRLLSMSFSVDFLKSKINLMEI